MTMDFFLARDLQRKLTEQLGTIPDLVEDLSITITRQARVQRPGLGKPRRQKPESQVPFHIGASGASAELHNCLAGWVRLVCEQRAIIYEGHGDIVTLARWLRRNMVALALTEGSEESCDDICHHIAQCRRMIDLPPEDDVVIDRARVNDANRMSLTAGQVEKIAGKLGSIAKGLNKRRVETLVRNKMLSPCSVDGEVQFYRLGDVLDAHHRYTKRNKGKIPS